MGRLNPGIEKQKKERKNRDDRKVVEKGKTWMTKMKKTFEISRRKNPAHPKKKKIQTKTSPSPKDNIALQIKLENVFCRSAVDNLREL